MELSLIRSLMDKSFYADHRGARCPDRLFSKDVRKIKQTIDAAMDKYARTVTPDEIEAIFMSENTTLTTAQKTAYSDLFLKIKREQSLGKDVAADVLSKLFQQVVGEDIANLGFDYVNGTISSLQPLRDILDNYTDDFIPNLNVDWDDLSIESLLSRNDLESRWTFNIPTLARKVEGVNDGHLVIIGARSNTGKTSFHASMIAGPSGFARQGAKCIILCNEESGHRVGARYLSAATGMTLKEVQENPHKAHTLYDAVKQNIMLYDSTGKDMPWVESVCKSYKPDIVVLDMGDKFANFGGFSRPDEALKANAIYARQIAKEYGCAIFYMSQLNAEAEGRVNLDQSMMEGARTGKAAEADLMILIAKSPQTSNNNGDAEVAEDDGFRHLVLAKNKLTGWHGRIVCEFNYLTGRYEA